MSLPQSILPYFLIRKLDLERVSRRIELGLKYVDIVILFYFGLMYLGMVFVTFHFV